MRVMVEHRTLYAYARPARAIVQLLRLTPSPHDGQATLDWRIDPSADGVLRGFTDAHGNAAHIFYCDGPVERIELVASGAVLTEERAGVVRGGFEPLPPAAYLRPTPLTAPDAALAALAHDAAAGAGDTLARLHALMARVHGALTFDDDATHVATDAAGALALGRGVCQDFAHIFCAGARLLGIPARYVSGHLARAEAQPAAHAWAEAHVEALGWVGFDASADRSPTEAYVRVAVAPDYLGASPVRGARSGGGEEQLRVWVAAGAAAQ